MTDQLEYDPSRMPVHAAEHHDVAQKWLRWPQGGESFLESFRRTHGAVAEPIAAALETLQARRVEFGAGQADAHRSVGDAITASLEAFNAREASNQRRLAAPVQEL